MIVAIVSGKGGTGKTTVSANLARALGSPVQLLDCDVEEPNVQLFLHGSLLKKEVVTVPVPQVDQALCDDCGECGRFCQYNAIVSFNTKPLLFPELCHGCGGCALVCPRRAIGETARRIGDIETVDCGNITLVQGRLDVGVAMSPPLIRAVKARLTTATPAILDAPPGTSCPVMTTLQGADMVILVTEPTPFGLYDLSLTVEMVRKLGISFGVVINRVGIGDNGVHRFCQEQNIDVFLELFEDRKIAEAYSRGVLAVEAFPEYRLCFDGLAKKIFKQCR
jgi:MinD superfamily P-loop ATPase